jgi:hypothetical protein
MPIAQSTAYHGPVSIHAGYYPGGRVGGDAVEGSDAASGGATPGWAVTVGGNATEANDAASGGADGPYMPTWVASTTRFTWGTIPNSNPTAWSGVGWAGTSPGGAGNWLMNFQKWSGMAIALQGMYDYAGNFHPGTIIVWQGAGHTDWSGNDMYGLGSLKTDSPQPFRIMNPTIPAPLNVARDGNGYVVAKHTYDTMQYLETANKIIFMGCQGIASGGGSLAAADIFNCATNPATGNPWAAIDTGFPSAGVGYNAQSGYDPVRKAAYMVTAGTGSFARWDEVAETWSSHACNNSTWASNGKASFDSLNNLLVQLGASGQVVVLQGGNLAAAPYAPTVTGTGPSGGGYSLDYDKLAKCHYAWDRTGTKLYVLTPGANPAAGGDNWVWSFYAGTGGVTPPDDYSLTDPNGGIISRLRVVYDPYGVVLHSDYRQAAVFFRLAP